MKHIKLLLMVMLVLFCAKAPAAPVDATAAQAVAEGFLKSSASGKLRGGVHSSLVLAHAEPASRAGMTDYYVFNTSDAGAFVIVAGDSRAADQVLAYGDGALDVSSLPCNVQWLLNEYKRQMEFLRTLPDQKGPRVPRSVRASSAITIEPLLTSKWSQSEPYYDQCPTYQGDLCVTGCVATAMAQVMYYWKYPEELPALSSYTTTSLMFEVPALPGTHLDWDNMLDVYKRYRPDADDNYTPEQGAAVATLMRYCGQACYMDYTPSASGALVNNQCAALKSFGYSEEAREIERDNYSREEWDEMLLRDLSAGRPVLYSGSSWDSGHAFVLDGYSNGKYHVNWGWGGSSDGYFTLDMLGSGEYAFNYFQDMVHNVYPTGNGHATVVFDFEENGIYYKANGDEAAVVTRDYLYNSYEGVVTIPATVSHEGKTYPVTAIGSNAFRNCQGLTNVVIPSSVRTVGECAFWNCNSLKEIYIGKGVNAIGEMAFRDCMSLEKVEIEDMASYARINFESFDSSPFCYSCKMYYQGEEVTELNIPGIASRIGNYAFCACHDITSVTIGEGVTTLGDYAFFDCPALTRVTLPGTLEKIGVCSFAMNEAFTDVTFGDGLKSIDGSAFYGCTGLRSLSFPASLDSIHYAAFAFCESVEQLELTGGDVWFGEASFYGCTSMKNVKCSPTQTSVGNSAFAACTSLSNIDLGNSLKRIEEYAFYMCNSLEEINIPETLETIGSYAFSSCSRLSRVNISNLDAWCGINFADEGANPLYFAQTLVVDGESVKDLLLPEDIRVINKYTFVGCTSLESVTIPASVAVIDKSAFGYCSGLTHVNAPSLEHWFDIDFKDEFANPLCSGTHLFIGGEELTRLVVPETVTAIGDNAFTGCVGLTDVAIGDQVTAVGNRAFSCCGNLANVTMGDGVKSVGERAFAGCESLKTVAMGRGIESIATKAFTQSMSITDITCKAQTPPALGAKDCFPLIVYKSAAVNVPNASLEAYGAASFWNQFKHLNGVSFDHIVGDVNHDGEVNIADINAVIHIILSGGEVSVADVNGDGEANIADVNAVIDEIFKTK